MSQHRMDYLVGQHQQALAREAAEQRLARLAKAARQDGREARPGRRLRWPTLPSFRLSLRAHRPAGRVNLQPR